MKTEIRNALLQLAKFICSGEIQEYLSNTSWLFADRAIRLVAGIIIGAWVARYLGPSQYGLLSFSLTICAIFTAISALGLDTNVVRDLVQKPNNHNAIMGTAFTLKLVMSIAVLLSVVIALNCFVKNGQDRIVILFVSMGVVFHCFGVIDFYFQSIVRSKYVVATTIFTLTIGYAIKIVLILSGSPLEYFAFLILFESILLGIGYIYFYRRNSMFSIISWEFDLVEAKTLLRDCWPILLSAIVFEVHARIDVIVVKNVLGNESVGQYVAAARLTNLLYFFPIILSASIFPKVVRAKVESKEKFLKTIQYSYDFLVILAILIALLVTIFGSGIIHLLYGAEYKVAGEVLVIHIWSIVFVFLSISSTKFLILESKYKVIFFRSLVGLVTNLVFSLLLIDSYGLSGVAMATLLSWFFCGYLYDLLDKDMRYMFYLKSNTLNIYRLIRTINRAIVKRF